MKIDNPNGVDFDWSHKPSIVVEAVDETSIYTNPDGNVVIRQRNPMGEDDSFVVIHLQHVSRVIKALKELSKK